MRDSVIFAAVLILFAGTATAATTTMTVDVIHDEKNNKDYPADGADPHTDINNLAEQDKVVVESGSGFWWEARYSDPSSIPASATIESVVVTVQYRMEGGWNGTLTLQAFQGMTGPLGSTTKPEYSSATLETWDVTTVVNGGTGGPLATLNDLRVRLVNVSNGKKVYWSYTKVDVTYSSPPNAPGVVSVPGSPASVSRNAAGISASYSDDDGDPQNAADWELWHNAGTDVLVATSLNDPINKLSIDVADLSFSSGGPLLEPLTSYFVRVRHRDDGGLWGDWTESTAFTTVASQAPDAPDTFTIPGSPASVARDVSSIAATYNDTEGDAHKATDWEIWYDTTVDVLIAHLYDDTSDPSTVAVADMTFDVGGPVLEAGTQYYVVARHQNEYDVWGPTSQSATFTTIANQPPNAPGTPSVPGAPTSVSRVVAGISATYSDPDGDPVGAADWEIYDVTGGNVRVAYLLGATSETTSVDLADMSFDSGGPLLEPLNQYYVRVRHQDDPGLWSATWTQSATFTTVASQQPDAPGSVSVPGSPTSVSRDVTGITATYNDSEGDAHKATDWEIWIVGAPDARVASSLGDATNLLSVDLADMSFDSGGPSLEPASQYYVRTRHQNEYDVWGDWATSATFTTRANVAPNAPGGPTIPGSPAGVSRTVTGITATYFDPDGDTQQAADWEVWIDSSTDVRVASSLGDTTNTLSIDLADMTLDNGRPSLDPLTDYYARVRHQDSQGGWGTWTTSTTFTTVANAAPATPTITSPTGGQADVVLSPTITASTFSDPDLDGHASSTWEIAIDAGFSTVVASAVNNATYKEQVEVRSPIFTFCGTHAGNTQLDPDTEYYVRVTYFDDAAIAASAQSAGVQFFTGLYPTSESWPFYGSGCQPGASSGITVLALVAGMALLRATSRSRRGKPHV